MASATTRVLSLILFAILAILQYQLWYGQGSIEDMWRLKRTIAIADIQNAHMIERNVLLQADVNDLRQGDEAVEERARSHLGMIRKGEHFYQLID
ncbi:MAG: cell division protein FtsB [Coxiellaceae bacterium]|nr:cell division protein FtsB [Coxiellaceae bacterium]